MKNLQVLFAVAILFLCSCVNNEADTTENVQLTSSKSKTNQLAAIATVKDGKVIFTNKEQLIVKLESELKALDKSNVKIANVIIDYSKASDDTTLEMIQLIGSSVSNSVQISYVLKKEKNEFFIQSKNTVLVCEGCRSGCSPRRKANGDGYCTKCDYQAKTCIKTETLPAFTE